MPSNSPLSSSSRNGKGLGGVDSSRWPILAGLLFIITVIAFAAIIWILLAMGPYPSLSGPGYGGRDLKGALLESTSKVNGFSAKEMRVSIIPKSNDCNSGNITKCPTNLAQLSHSPSDGDGVVLDPENALLLIPTPIPRSLLHMGDVDAATTNSSSAMIAILGACLTVANNLAPPFKATGPYLTNLH
jgi:hypothetical protein